MRLPKYRKHSKQDCGFAQWNKRRKYFRGKFESEESRRAYDQWIKDVVLATDPLAEIPRDGSAQVSACLALFMQHAREYYGSARGSEYHNFVPVVRAISELYGHVPISSITPKHVKSLLEYFATTPGKRGRTKDGAKKDWHRSRDYCNTCLRRSKQILKWLTQEEYCPPAVYHGALSVAGLKPGKSPARESRGRKPVEWNAVAKTLKHLPPAVAAMVQIQWHTGCRPGQVCQMRREEIETKGELWVWTPQRHKTAHKQKVLTIFIGPRCQQVLAPFLAGDGYVFAPEGSRAGDYYRSTSYRQAVVRAAQRAAVERWTPHQIRHARGTEVEDRYDALAAQATLGHARINTTKLYTSQAHARARLVAMETG